MPNPIYKHFPISMRKTNTNRKYKNGTIWNTNKAGEVVIIGEDSTLSYDKKGRASRHRVVIRFTDGTILSVDKSALNRGAVDNPNRPSVYKRGFIGIGNWGGYDNKKATREYVLWVSMFTRSYDPRTWEKHPTYRDCSVDERWYNFQNFCEDIIHIEGYDNWLKFGSSKYHLDKDIKFQGNKLYSNKTCLFVSCVDNSRAATGNKIKYNAYYKGKFMETFTICRDFAKKVNISESSLNRIIHGVYEEHKGWSIKKADKEKIERNDK